MQTLSHTEELRRADGIFWDYRIQDTAKKPCSCGCPKAATCPRALAQFRKKAPVATPTPDETIQAVTRDYFINLFNWLGDLPFPLNLLAFVVNCALHSATLPMVVYIAPTLWSHLQSVWNSSRDPSVKAYYAVLFIIADIPGTSICSCLPAELWYYASIGYFKVENQPMPSKR